MSYMETMTCMLSEAKDSIHERHIYEYELMTRQMIEELVPQIVLKTLNECYMDLWLKLRMVFEGKEVYFQDVADYVVKELENALQQALSKMR